MGYFLTAEAESAVPGNSLARPKTHTPGARVSNLGQRFYSAEIARFPSRDPINETGFIGRGCSLKARASSGNEYGVPELVGHTDYLGLTPEPNGCELSAGSWGWQSCASFGATCAGGGATPGGTCIQGLVPGLGGNLAFSTCACCDVWRRGSRTYTLLCLGTGTATFEYRSCITPSLAVTYTEIRNLVTTCRWRWE